MISKLMIDRVVFYIDNLYAHLYSHIEQRRGGYCGKDGI